MIRVVFSVRSRLGSFAFWSCEAIPDHGLTALEDVREVPLQGEGRGV
jgi:hypothetical protein